MSVRIGVLVWLLGWLVLTAVQIALFLAFQADGSTTSMVIGCVIVILLMIPKYGLYLARLNDLGRPSDDAWLSLVPLANVGLWIQMLSSTPSPTARDKAISAWKSDVLAGAALGEGARRLVQTLSMTAPVILIGGVLLGLSDELPRWFARWVADPRPPEKIPDVAAYKALLDTHHQALTAHAEVVVPYEQLAFGLAAILGVITLFQLSKSDTASRKSWIPSLFFFPSLLIGLAIHFRAQGSLGPLLAGLPFQALDLLWSALIGGTLAWCWTAAAQAADSKRNPWEEAKTLTNRLTDAIAVHGGAAIAIFIGLQVLIPGIHYLLVYAFVDFAAITEPNKPSFQRSSALSVGIRRRIAKVMLVPAVVYLIPAMGVQLYWFGPQNVMESLIDPGKLPLQISIFQGVLWIFVSAWTTLSLWSIWRERVVRTQPILATNEENPSVWASSNP